MGFNNISNSDLWHHGDIVLNVHKGSNKIE